MTLKVSNDIYLLLQTKCQCSAETDSVGSNAAAEQTEQFCSVKSNVDLHHGALFFCLSKDDIALSKIILLGSDTINQTCEIKRGWINKDVLLA